jgi:hypothetical protein
MKLSSKYIFLVHIANSGAHSIITRISDGTQKYFFQAGMKDTSGLEGFFNGMTDDLLDGYFTKPRHGEVVDNWKYLGENKDRYIASRLAENQFAVFQANERLNKG